MDLFIPAILTIITAATPLLFAALGEMVTEKSGILNLGVEGMMVMGAIIGFIAMHQTGSITAAIMASMLAGAGMAAVFALFVLVFHASQVPTGLALTLFGIGLSALIGQSMIGVAFAGIPRLAIPLLSLIPVVGSIFFQQDFLVYLSIFMVFAIHYFLQKTRAGLILRAVGDSHDAAHAMGYSVRKIRFLAILFGGAMSGLGGAYLSLAYSPMWVEQMTAGRGWIALALVVFASWRVGRIMLGAYLLGFASIMHLVIQGFGFSISSNLLATLPYLATIIVLVFLSKNLERLKQFEPMALGKPWHKTH